MLVRWLIYRCGIHTANQPDRPRVPIALVEAATLGDALAKANEQVGLVGSQHVEVVAEGEAPEADLREVFDRDEVRTEEWPSMRRPRR